jgi:hypothetical protein
VILAFIGSSANVAFNNAGQIVFSSALTGPGVTVGLDDSAIFGWDPGIGLVMIARKGVTSVPEILEVSQLVLIGSSGFTGENGSAILTDNGWLTFRMQDVKGLQAVIRTKPFEAQCPADVNGNSVVDVDDLLAVINVWGFTGSNPADVDGSGTVDVDDLLIVVAAWGSCP